MSSSGTRPVIDEVELARYLTASDNVTTSEDVTRGGPRASSGDVGTDASGDGGASVGQRSGLPGWTVGVGLVLVAAVVMGIALRRRRKGGSGGERGGDEAPPP